MKMTLVCTTISSLLLIFALLQNGLCVTPCQDLETADMSDFNIKKHVGSYEFVMAILGDGIFSKFPFKCNRVTIIQHPYPSGGINAAFTLYLSDKKTVADTYVVHLNSSTDVYMAELAGYHPTIEKWTNIYCKILLATDDLFVYSVCIENMDEPEDTDFLVVVFRKDGSKLSLSEISDMLPDSIKNNPKLVPVCNK